MEEKIKKSDEESSPETSITLLISVGGTIIHASLVSKTIKKGVWGIQKSIENPLKITINGDENSSNEENRKNTIIENLNKIYRSELPKIFDNVKPDELEFETIDVDLRLHIDLGNKISALFLGGLSCLYILKSKFFN